VDAEVLRTGVMLAGAETRPKEDQSGVGAQGLTAWGGALRMARVAPVAQRGVEQELEKLTSRGGSRSLLEPRVQDGGRPHVEGGDVVPQVGERGTHPRGGGVDAHEARAEADEVGVVTIDEADELGTERGEVGAELGG
jgi:hypothetical protein